MGKCFYKNSFSQKILSFFAPFFWFFYNKLMLRSFKGKQVVMFSDFDTSFKIVLDRKNGLVDEMIFLTKTWERDVLKIIKENASSSGVFLDIGANIGVVSLFASFYFKSVFAFEPLNDLCDQFEESVKLNKMDNLTVYRFGCWDVAKKGFVSIPPGNVGGSSLIFDDKFHDSSKVLRKKISLIKLDDFFVWDVDFVKLDIEGAELKCLKGMERILKRSKPKIIFELNSFNGFGRNIDLVDFLFGLGYSIFVGDVSFSKRSRSEFVSFLSSKKYSTLNLFCE